MTGDLVLDPSVVLAWLLDDEHEPTADTAMESLPAGTTWVLFEESPLSPPV